jgi:hypothetical protein
LLDDLMDLGLPASPDNLLEGGVWVGQQQVVVGSGNPTCSQVGLARECGSPTSGLQ